MTKSLTVPFSRLTGILVILSLAISAFTLNAATWYVSTDGSDETGSGSFGAPFACIQYAADVASTGDSIVVKPGLYAGDGNRDMTFGGKALTITSSNGPEATTIDVEGTAANPHRAMTFTSNVDNSFLVSGITFRNGYATDAGGLVYVNTGCTPRFENCAFEFAEASDGAAIYFHDNSGGEILNSSFVGNNSANLGGAVFVELGSVATFENCDFIDNSSNSYAGVAMVGTNSEATFSNCLFADASAVWGGGVIYAVQSNVTLDNCSLVKASATWSGDVILLGSANLTLTNTLIHTIEMTAPVVCNGSSTLSISCSNVYSPEYSGWFGCIDSYLGINGNIAADPMFVDYESGDYRVEAGSPNSPDNNSCGALIGSEEALGAQNDCGDMDADGLVSITDAVYVVNYIFADGPAPQDSYGGDVDCNDRTDITDAVYLINYIFAGGNTPCAGCE